MNRRLLWLVRGLAAIIIVSEVSHLIRSAPAPSPEPVALFRETSPGGIPYLRIGIPGHLDVRVATAWPSDSANHDQENQDVPSVASRLLPRGGAEGYPAGEAHEVFDDLRAETALWVEPSLTGLYLDVPRSKLDAAVSLLNAHLRAPLMSETWFRRVRAEVAAENRERAARPDLLVHDALRVALIGDGPLRRSLTGETPARVMSMTREELVAWQRAVITRRPEQVIIAGSISRDEAGRAVDGLFHGLPQPEAVPRPVTAAADFHPRRILLHLPSASTSRLILAGPLPAIAAGVKPEDDVILDALAGPGGQLTETARGKLKAAYDFTWDVDQPTDGLRYFRLEGEIETAKLARAETALRDSYAQLRAKAAPLHAEQARERMRASLEADRDDPSAAAAEALHAWATRQDLTILSDPAVFTAGLSAATAARRLRDAFPPADDLIIIAVSPDAAALPGACIITAPEQAARCP